MDKNLQLRKLIAKQIRLLRLKKGMTQEGLAEKADLGFNYIYRLENKYLNLKIETIEKIMNALEVDINTFFNINDIHKNKELNQLINDIESLPTEKIDPTIKALRSLLKQIK